MHPFLLFFFWLHCAACRTSLSRDGTQAPCRGCADHWTTREVPAPAFVDLHLGTRVGCGPGSLVGTWIQIGCSGSVPWPFIIFLIISLNHTWIVPFLVLLDLGLWYCQADWDQVEPRKKLFPNNFWRSCEIKQDQKKKRTQFKKYLPALTVCQALC